MQQQSARLAVVAMMFATLLQGCATVPEAGTAGVRALPQARIQLEAPAFDTTPRFARAPDLAGFLSRGSRALAGVLQSALSFTGTRYRYGGSSPLTGFDCSGFVGYVFRESAGLKLPRASYQMASVDGRKLTREELKAGDLVFFAQRKRVNHVGIYLGEDRFIHAPSTGGRVRTDSLANNYWRKRFVNGKRVIDPASFEDTQIVAGNAASAAAGATAGSAAAQDGMFRNAGGGAR